MNKDNKTIVYALLILLFSGLSLYFYNSGNLDITGKQVTNSVTLTVEKTGDGHGNIISSPEGLNCDQTICTGTFQLGTYVTLTAIPNTDDDSFLYSWSQNGNELCSWTDTCEIFIESNQIIKAEFLTTNSIPNRAWGDTGSFYSGGTGQG